LINRLYWKIVEKSMPCLLNVSFEWLPSHHPVLRRGVATGAAIESAKKSKKFFFAVFPISVSFLLKDHLESMLCLLDLSKRLEKKAGLYQSVNQKTHLFPPALRNP
jgi:hypothetical protein